MKTYYESLCYPPTVDIGVRVQFRLGGLRSVARIFSPLLARKSSGFARILPDFLPEYGYFQNSRGGCSPPSPPPPPPGSYAYDCGSELKWCVHSPWTLISICILMFTSGCVYHHYSGVELGFQTTFRVIFADDKRKAVLIRGLETPF